MKKLMIVDDSHVMRKAIEKYLKDFNLEIVGSAENGRKGLVLFKKSRPDIVTLDITMPEMDGLSLLDEIMKIDPDTRVIIITALSDRDTGIQAMKKGASGFLSKPFTPAQLKEEFSQVMRSPA